MNFQRCRSQAIYTVIIVVITILLTIIAVLLLNSIRKEDKDENTISNEIVIDRVEEKFFAVTRTVFSDQKTAIKVDQGSDWSNFWWNKTINAEARVRVDLGVDFSDLEEEDVRVDETAKKIYIKSTGAEILDASIDDNLEIEVDGSILTKVFARDYNEEYETVSEELVDSATRAIEADEDLLEESVEETERLLNYLFIDSGYTVVLED